MGSSASAAARSSKAAAHATHTHDTGTDKKEQLLMRKDDHMLHNATCILTATSEPLVVFDTRVVDSAALQRASAALLQDRGGDKRGGRSADIIHQPSASSGLVSPSSEELSGSMSPSSAEAFCFSSSSLGPMGYPSSYGHTTQHSIQNLLLQQQQQQQQPNNHHQQQHPPHHQHHPSVAQQLYATQQAPSGALALLSQQLAEVSQQNHPFLRPFGQQQSIAMQVEDDMEYIMDRPIPAVNLEDLGNNGSSNSGGAAKSRKLRKTASSSGATTISPETTTRSINGGTSTQPGGGAQLSSSFSSSSAFEPTAAFTMHHHQQLQHQHLCCNCGDEVTPFHHHGGNSGASSPPRLSSGFKLVQSNNSDKNDNSAGVGERGQPLPMMHASPNVPTFTPVHRYSPVSGFSDNGNSGLFAAPPCLAALPPQVEALPAEQALPIVQAAMYDENSEGYQQYKSAWLRDRETSAREQAHASQLAAAVAQGLLTKTQVAAQQQQQSPRHHVRQSSRSMFGVDSIRAGSPGGQDLNFSPGQSPFHTRSPAAVSPNQPSSPATHAMQSRAGGGGYIGFIGGVPITSSMMMMATAHSPLHHIRAHSGYTSPLRSMSPLGTPHSPTIFATLLESNSRNPSRNISPLPISPLASAREGAPLQQMHLPPPHRPPGSGQGPGGGHADSTDAAAGSPLVHRSSISTKHMHHRSADFTLAAPVVPISAALANSIGAGSTNPAAAAAAVAPAGGGGGAAANTLYDSYASLRIGWIPSDVSGAVPVPYQ